MAKQLVTRGKGVLAADESLGSIGKRFEALGIENSHENRKAYREMLFGTPGAEEYISGAITFDETLRDGLGQMLSEKGIIPGIKVDKGTVELANFPGEKVTEGLDGLAERLKEYAGMGAKFTKWRAVIKIGAGMPTTTCINVNAEILARYAALSQAAGLVPFVEPEVLLDDGHDLERCREVTDAVWQKVFEKLAEYKIEFEGMILKASMVIAMDTGAEEVARETVALLRRRVPVEVGGIVFLSGGQDEIRSTLNLNEMNKINPPWQLSFSYGRALQDSALKTWVGKAENVESARQTFLHRAKMNSLATKGEYQQE